MLTDNFYKKIIELSSESSEKFWMEEFTKRGALWIHDDNPVNPHALLASGKHSSGFFNASKIVCEYPRLAFEANACLCEKVLWGMGMGYSLADWIFGSAHGATCIANNVGILLNIPAGFTEKVGGRRFELMRVNKRFNVKKDDRIIMVDDVLTTGGTTLKSIDALEKNGATVLPFIVVFVNRSGKTHIDGRSVVSLIDKDMPIWESEDCPLCKQGSEAVIPKDNWNKLVGASVG